MLTTTRHGVFETNSSSVHTICYKNPKSQSTRTNDVDWTKHTNSNGILQIDVVSYGCDYCEYCTLTDKLGYLIALACHTSKCTESDVSVIVRYINNMLCGADYDFDDVLESRYFVDCANCDDFREIVNFFKTYKNDQLKGIDVAFDNDWGIDHQSLCDDGFRELFQYNEYTPQHTIYDGPIYGNTIPNLTIDEFLLNDDIQLVSSRD